MNAEELEARYRQQSHRSRELFERGRYYTAGAATVIEIEIARAMCRRVDSLERIRVVNSGT